MRLKRALIAGVLGGLAVVPALAAPPAISAAETSVRLGLTSGYGAELSDTVPQASGPLVGVTAGISGLTPVALAKYGWPDLYTGVSYDFSAGFLRGREDGMGMQPGYGNGNGTDYYNNAVVRLGLGRPVSEHLELIPYIAGGYQNSYRPVRGVSAYDVFYQAGMAGIGMKLDMVANQLWVVSADAEGDALLGGSESGTVDNGGFGAGAEERVSLGADYRLNGAWHAFAGLGFTHYGVKGQNAALAGGQGSSAAVQVNSMFGVTYGF